MITRAARRGDGAGAPGGPLQRQSPARGAPDAVPRSGAALDSYTAGFGSGSDSGLPNVPSREADGLTDRRPQHYDLRKRRDNAGSGQAMGAQMLYTSSGTRQAADSNDDSNGASQPLPRTHDNIQPRSGLISRTGRPLRLKNGRSRVAPTPLRSLPRVGISDSFLTDWPDGTGLWHLYRTPIRGATVGTPVATPRCLRPCGSSRCEWSLNAAGCSNVAKVMDDLAE